MHSTAVRHTIVTHSVTFDALTGKHAQVAPSSFQALAPPYMPPDVSHTARAASAAYLLHSTQCGLEF